jgi:hypothetical protein
MVDYGDLWGSIDNLWAFGAKSVINKKAYQCEGGYGQEEVFDSPFQKVPSGFYYSWSFFALRLTDLLPTGCGSL